MKIKVRFFFSPNESISFKFVDNIIVIAIIVIIKNETNNFSHILFFSMKNTDPPEVTLTLGSTLNPDDIKENDDVYFECNVKANPSTVRISWSHDVSILFYFYLRLI
jgi:hypothetical protein